MPKTSTGGTEGATAHMRRDRINYAHRPNPANFEMSTIWSSAVIPARQLPLRSTAEEGTPAILPLPCEAGLSLLDEDGQRQPLLLTGERGSRGTVTRVDVERLIRDLSADDWQVAARAASALREAPGQQVIAALVAALDAPNTAITAAVAESLILRNEPGTADRMWSALATLSDDVTDHIWDLVENLPEEEVSRDLKRRPPNAYRRAF